MDCSIRNTNYMKVWMFKHHSNARGDGGWSGGGVVAWCGVEVALGVGVVVFGCGNGVGGSRVLW